MPVGFAVDGLHVDGLIVVGPNWERLTMREDQKSLQSHTLQERFISKFLEHVGTLAKYDIFVR